MADVEFKNTTGVVWFDTIISWISVAIGVDLGLDDINAYDNVLDVTPDNSNDLSKSGLIYIGTGGNIKVDLIQFGTVTFLNVPNGRFIQSRVKKVYSTGTTASDLIVIF